MKHLLRSSDLLCGLFLCTVAAGFLISSRHYEMGTPTQMGPAFFPVIVATMLALVGLLLCVKALVSTSTVIQATPVRPLLVVLAAIGSFGMLLRPAGLVIALAVSLTTACFARRNASPLGVLAIVAALLVLGVVIFHSLLGITINLWPG